jgi:quercetin dioxygenase-like cupin family protein
MAQGIGHQVDYFSGAIPSYRRGMTNLTTLMHQTPPFLPTDAEVMTAIVELPPGDPGTPPHRHSGPVFGYLLEGEMVFELEGEPERVIGAGQAFWEPGGDVIHYQAANNLTDAWTRFVIVMVGVPGEPMLTLVDEAELQARRDRRAPRPAPPSASPPGTPVTGSVRRGGQ